MRIEATYNERSWAIDLIGYIKSILNSSNLIIKDVGGEHTIKVNAISMYPDVLLFGDHSSATILQGWELKMPDTNIDDLEFYQNAEQKANALGLNSFLLWNVSFARLFVRDENTSLFILNKEWDELKEIKSRNLVKLEIKAIEALANEIILTINDLLVNKKIEGRQFIDAYKSGGITPFVKEGTAILSDTILNHYKSNNTFKKQVDYWWNSIEIEYSGEKKHEVLASVALSNWIGKFLFSQILKSIDNRARIVETINETTTPEEALKIFSQLSSQCNFWTIFSDSFALSLLPNTVWWSLIQFNFLLSDLRIGSIDQSQLSDILEVATSVELRKLRGQYTTPMPLANLIICIGIEKVDTDRIIDLCCGSGTIVRAALEYKLNADISPDIISKTIYASDIDFQAVQVTSISLAKPELINYPNRVFQKNLFELDEDLILNLRDPSTGNPFNERLGQFDLVVGNLPFVSQEGRELFRRYLNKFENILGDNRSDISAYIPFVIHPLLSENGKFIFIITNAWLSTDWGEKMKTALSDYFHINTIVISGCGRWFKNSKVVTHLVELEKIDSNNIKTSDTKFVVLKNPIDSLIETDYCAVIASQIEYADSHTESMNIRKVSQDRLNLFRQYGLAGNAQFVDCDWILDLPLSRLSDFFSISRGSRGGDNAFFYPKGKHGIEEEFIFNLVKSPSDFKRINLDNFSHVVFYCQLSIEELKVRGFKGALNWIDKNSSPTRTNKLKKKGREWYQLDIGSLTELVMFINYGERIFSGRIVNPAFVDQRLVRLVPLHTLNLDLMSALLNSTISLFFIEGMGFGRGLGALDLNSYRINRYFHVLNPNSLSPKSVELILSAFSEILKRDVLPVNEELESIDRIAFDTVILKEFNINVSIDRIYNSLRELYSIRLQNSL